MKQPLHQSEGQQPVILVIDDNPAIRDMVSWALELDGYEPAEAAEGQEALNWLRSAAHEGRYPSVILLDLAMPGMDGNTFLERLHQQWAHMSSPHPLPAIVVITADSSSSDAMSMGVQQVIVKPFHVRDLLDVVRRLAQELRDSS
jgi:two-component system, chemotaxis family, chemotaxis protein CheY